MPALLKVENLKIYFAGKEGPNKAVDGVSFTIGHGETIGIVGESGSGKSVTALSILRLLQEDKLLHYSGKMIWQENEKEPPVDLLQTPQPSMMAYRGRQIGMIFQDPKSAFNPILTCGDQVLEALQIANPKLNAPKEHILSWFEKVRLPNPQRIFDAFPHQLSGGQLQRVGLVMAMIMAPKLILADEPTTALDVTTQKEILELFQQVQLDLKSSALFISHDFGVIAQLAQRVVVMYQGKIVETGETKQILHAPKHPYTQALLACRPLLRERRFRLPTIRDFFDQEEIPSSSLFDQPRFSPISDQFTKEREDLLYQHPPILTVDQLSIAYPLGRRFFWQKPRKLLAVSEASLALFPGEILGLVGESGSGKTSLGKAIVGLIRPTKGQLQYRNSSLWGDDRQENQRNRKEIQMVFQNPYASLNPSMTIGQAIMEPMKVHGIGDHAKHRIEKAVELLEMVGLTADHLHRFPYAFSGGQRQRIAIARALAVQPKLLICDEAVSALDVSVQAQILNLLADLANKLQLTYLFISHDLSVIRFLCDRVVVMKQGQIVETGLNEAIFSAPQHPYTKNLLAAIPTIE